MRADIVGVQQAMIMHALEGRLLGEGICGQVRQIEIDGRSAALKLVEVGITGPGRLLSSGVDQKDG